VRKAQQEGATGRRSHETPSVSSDFDVGKLLCRYGEIEANGGICYDDELCAEISLRMSSDPRATMVVMKLQQALQTLKVTCERTKGSS
jgi:hypothetical protein